MKLAEAWKMLSIVFPIGNLNFQMHDTNLNHKSVSEFYSHMKVPYNIFLLKCIDVCDLLNARLPIFEQRFNVTRFVRLLHLKQLEASRDDEMSKNYLRSIYDEFFAACQLLANEFKYFVNVFVQYDYKNRIWKPRKVQD